MPKPPKENVTLALVMVNDANGDGKPNHGDGIAFTVDPANTEWNQIQVIGTQNGAVVYGALFGPYASPVMTLSSQAWASGACDCEATLERFHDNNPKKTETLARLTFTVAA